MIRKYFEAGFKAKVAMEAVKGEQTLSELSSKYGVHSNVISKWKRELLQGASEIFSNRKGRHKQQQEEDIDQLYKIIGKLKVENDGLKKN